MKRIFVIFSLLAMVFGFAAFQCASTEITSARLYIQQKNYEKAKEALLKEVEKNPKSAEGYFLLGYLSGEENDIEKMIEYYDKSLEINNQFQKEINDNKNYHWANNFNRGVAFFNRAGSTTDEDSTRISFNKAIESFEKAILAQPDSVDTYKNLTFAYLNAGRIDEAIYPLQKLVDHGGSADSYSMLGEIYINKGQESMRKFNESGNVEDSLTAIDNFNEAITILKKGREEFPDDGDILLYLSNAYINADKLDVAMETFQEGVKRDPNNKYYRYNYGVLLLEAEDFEGAEEQFQKAVDIDPEYSNGVYNLAATYVKWGTKLRDEAEAAESNDAAFKEKFEMALPHLEKYLELNPEDSAMWELLGRVYANLGMTEKSMEAFDKADQTR